MFSEVVQDVVKHFVTNICVGASFLQLILFAVMSPIFCVYVCGIKLLVSVCYVSPLGKLN